MKTDIIFICVGDSISSKILRKHGEVVFQAYRYQNRIAYRLRYLLHLLHIDEGRLFSLNPEIIKYETNTFAIVDSLVYEPIIAQLRHLFPNSTIKYLYTNIVACKASMNPNILRKYHCQLYSWDIQDCNKYDLIYQRSSYEEKLAVVGLPNKYDLCFIGVDKGRYKSIKALEEYSKKNGLRFFTHICANHNFLKWTHSYYKSPIPYEEYLAATMQSSCIVDFVQKGQSGTTMRTMEAIFLNKKLISNNPLLKEMDFYHPENIFIAEDDSYEGLVSFLKTDMVPVEPEVLVRYTYPEWRKAILNTND